MINGVYETTTTAGTGTITLAAVNGRPRFSDCGVGEIVPYAINDGNDWEWGFGIVSAGNTLARTTVRATYVSGVYDTTAPAAITLSGSAADVYLSNLAEATDSSMPYIKNTGKKGIYSSHITAVPNASLTATVDRLYIMPFKLESSYQCNGAYIDMETVGAASTKARIGIYRIGTTGDPTDVICESADIDTSVASGILTATWAEKRLPPGWYGIAIVCSGAPIFKAHTSTAVTQTPFGIEASASSLLPIVMLYKAIAGWTSLPASPASLLPLSAGAAATVAIALRIV